MTFTREQKKEAYKKLSPEVQSFIMDPETNEMITNHLNESGLTPEQSNLADSEILYAMFELQTLSDAINNIAKLSGKNVNDFSKLKINLENSVFSEINRIKNVSKPEEVVPTGEKIVTKENIVVPNNLPGNKIHDIADKYSIDANRAEILKKIVSESSGLETKDVLEKNIVTKLGVSGLLAEQIGMDIMHKSFKNINEVKKVNASDTISRVPELAPKNLPMIEIGVPVPPPPPISLIPKPAQVYQPITQKTDIEFDLDAFVKQAPAPQPVTTQIEKKEVLQTPATSALGRQQYTVDPYREPLE